MKRIYKFKKIANETENVLIVNDHIIEKLCGEHDILPIDTVEDYSDMIAMPGFIDCHMHGAMGFDAATCGAENLVELAKNLYKHGEAGFLPTIPAAHPEQNLRALEEIENAMRITWERTDTAKILGCHMEGPFMCEKYKGALDETSFCDCNTENWKKLTGDYEPVVKRITVDPLRKGVIDMIPYFTHRGIQVSLGHTAADSDTVERALQAGATSVTHLYNAMSGLHHREPGTVGAALASDTCYCEIISDFLHVNPKAVKLAVKAKTPGKMAVITDSCQAAGMPDGEYVLGGRLIYVINGEARMPEGQLASSTVFMDRELKNILSLGFSLDACAVMLSKNPAFLSGESRLGSLTAGKMFIAVLTDEKGNIKSVIS